MPSSEPVTWNVTTSPVVPEKLPLGIAYAKTLRVTGSIIPATRIWFAEARSVKAAEPATYVMPSGSMTSN